MQEQFRVCTLHSLVELLLLLVVASRTGLIFVQQRLTAEILQKGECLFTNGAQRSNYQWHEAVEWNHAASDV
jgi:hypothetical protein